MLTDGRRTLSVQVAGGEVATFPDGSRALLAAEHLRRCTPTPEIGTETLAWARHRHGASSSEHPIPDTPETPAAAAALTRWTPAVAGASVGPDIWIDTGWLSIATLLLALLHTSAAFSA